MNNNAYQIVERLFRIHCTSLYYFANRYIQNPNQAKDIVNETFATLLDRAGEFNEEESMLDFLYIKTKQTCTKIRRLACEEAETIEQAIYLAETMRELDKKFEELPCKTLNLFLTIQT